MRLISTSVVVICLCLLAVAKDKKKHGLPSPEELAAITARGRMIEEYDVAAWHATDVVQDMKPEAGITRFYIAKKTGATWEVVFGRMSEAHDKFLIVYQATQGTQPENFTAKGFDPPLENTDFYFAAAKAFDAALADLGKVTRPYNAYAIPSESGQLYVYLLPAQTKNEIYPLGGDVRYTFSADGNSLVEKHPMHKTVLDIDDSSADKGAKLASGWHTHVLSNVPEDSDVFHVLTRKPSIPEYVGTMDKKIWVINTDGTILLGK